MNTAYEINRRIVWCILGHRLRAVNLFSLMEISGDSSSSMVCTFSLLKNLVFNFYTLYIERSIHFSKTGIYVFMRNKYITIPSELQKVSNILIRFYYGLNITEAINQFQRSYFPQNVKILSINDLLQRYLIANP